MRMLSKPYAGWTDFCLGDRTYSLSYVTNIPLDWLEQAIHGLETLLPFAVHGFCEPGRVLCLVSYWNCHVIFEDDGKKELLDADSEWEFAHISMLEFCKALYADISENLDDWSDWTPLYADSEEEHDESKCNLKMQIKEKLDRLEALIKEKSECFEGNCWFF